MSALGTWLRQAWQSLGAEWIKPQRAGSPPHSGFEVLDFQIFSFLKERGFQTQCPGRRY